jgi:hypothetical protein
MELSCQLYAQAAFLLGKSPLPVPTAHESGWAPEFAEKGVSSCPLMGIGPPILGSSVRSTTQASITLDGVTLTDTLIR